MRRYTPSREVIARLSERLWSRVQYSEGCWEWTGGATTAGYGQLRDGRSSPIGTHRLAYIQLVGPIPDDLFVCHTCDNRRCVRPDHLFLGTNRDNQLDALAKGRLAVGERNSRSILTDAQVREIRRRASAGETHVSLAREYGVSRPTIGHAVSGRNWRAVS